MSTDRPNGEGLPSECPPAPTDLAGQEGPAQWRPTDPGPPPPPGVRLAGNLAGGGSMLPAPLLAGVPPPPGMNIAPPSLGSTTASCSDGRSHESAGDVREKRSLLPERWCRDSQMIEQHKSTTSSLRAPYAEWR